MAGDPRDVSEFGGQGAPLTMTERAVLAALARGVGVGQAAETLGWTERAVCEQFASAGRKLGAHSGLETLLIAVRRGDIRRPVVG